MSKLTSSSKQAVDWKTFIERYEQTSVSRRRFCQENNLPLHQFRYHLMKSKRLALAAKKPTLLPIHIRAESNAFTNSNFSNNASANMLQITLKNGISCQMALAGNPTHLKYWIEVLQSC